MAQTANPLLLSLLLILLFTLCQATDPCSSDGSDLSILPIYSKCSPFSPHNPAPLLDTVLSMARADPARLSFLFSQKSVVPIGPGQQIAQTSNYVVRAKLGSPAQTMYMVLDTSSDSSWVPCAGCTGCSPTAFSPAMSTTYQPLDCGLMQCAQMHGQTCPSSGPGPCVFNQSYGGDSSFSATLVQDSLGLGRDVVPGYGFGCINAVSGKSVPPQGLLGLGRGPMSLITQTAQLYKSTFSYCLPSFKSNYLSGSLRLGPASQPMRIRTTPLLLNPHRPSLYYVNLTAVSIGRKLIPAPASAFGFDPATGAGTIIDSGTVITRFVAALYNAVRDEFRAHIKGPISSLGAFDTCFDTGTNPATPAMTLHFTGLNLALPVENTLIHSSATSLACLAMAAAPANVNSVVNVIANLQQQNLRILFDLPNSRVGIAREVCN